MKKHFSWQIGCVLILVMGVSCPVLAGTWYVPMIEQVPGGFDFIQIKMLYPWEFDSPVVMSAFFGDDPSGPGAGWSQTFLSEDNVLATAEGPDMGDGYLYFSIWVAGDREYDRPTFHFQTYKGNTLVDNADLIALGPGEMDWIVAPGTWTKTCRITHVVTGDLTGDCYVDDDDLSLLLTNWHYAGTPYDLTGDDYIDDDDLSVLLTHWHDGDPPFTGMTIPEPATLVLMGLGAGALIARRRKLA